MCNKCDEMQTLLRQTTERMTEAINAKIIAEKAIGDMSKEIVELNNENEKLKQMVLRYRPGI